MKTINPHEAIDYMIRHSAEYAIAKAEVTYLTEFRKSKKALLFVHPKYFNKLKEKESLKPLMTKIALFILSQNMIAIYKNKF